MRHVHALCVLISGLQPEVQSRCLTPSMEWRSVWLHHFQQGRYIVKGSPTVEKYLAGAKPFLAYMEFPDPNKGDSLPHSQSRSLVRVSEDGSIRCGRVRKGNCRPGPREAKPKWSHCRFFHLKVGRLGLRRRWKEEEVPGMEQK
ncbi:hypothetical protein F5888DRAFT_783717 [Russula emetica]|nr:hypothetical protein F5888DRAFT_783717 [Russula emetica]